MHDVMRASSRARLTARITSCITYLIHRIFNNNLRHNITGVEIVWHSNFTKKLASLARFNTIYW